MSIFDVKPLFLYPHSNKYPFDAVAKSIVEELEKRNWKIPNIRVEFDIYGSGEVKYKKVASVKGKDFKLDFHRRQAKLDGTTFYDTAAISTIHIPKIQLEVHNGTYRPTLYMYVGDNWDNDSDWFFNSIKINAKRYGLPRKYLKYRGVPVMNSDDIPKLLINDCEGDNEYCATDEEPETLNFLDECKNIAIWLEEHVLNYICSFQKKDQLPIEDEYKMIPYMGAWDKLTALLPYGDIERISKGLKDLNLLSPEQRHATPSNFFPLIPLWVQAKGRLPCISRANFCWCDPNEFLNSESTVEDISNTIKEQNKNDIDFKGTLISIKPKYANGIFVIDDAAFESTKEKLAKRIESKAKLIPADLSEAYSARAATIIPINDYKGGYEKPIILIARELDFSEIEWINTCNDGQIVCR